MRPSAPPETNPVPNALNERIHSDPDLFRRYLNEVLLRGRESSHTMAIGLRLQGLDKCIRKELQVLATLVDDLKDTADEIENLMKNEEPPSQTPGSDVYSAPSSPDFDSQRQFFSPFSPFYREVVLPTVLKDTYGYMQELLAVINILCHILEDMEKPTHELAVAKGKLVTRKHFGSYVKSLHTDKPHLSAPPPERRPRVPTYPYLYNLTRVITNVLDVGGYRHYVGGTSSNPASGWGEMDFFAVRAEKEPTYSPVWKGRGGYGDYEFDYLYDFASLSPLHASALKSDYDTLKDFGTHGETFHPDTFPDFSVGTTDAQYANGPAGGGRSIPPLFGEVVVPEYNFMMDSKTGSNNHQDHRFTLSGGEFGLKTTSVQGGYNDPSVTALPPCSGVGVGGTIGRMMAKSAEKARNRRLRYLILMPRSCKARLRGLKKPKKKKAAPKKRRSRSDLDDTNGYGGFEVYTPGPMQSAAMSVLNNVIRPVLDVVSLKPPFWLSRLLGGADVVGPDVNDPFNQVVLPDFVLKDKYLQSFFSPLTWARNPRGGLLGALNGTGYNSRPNPIFGVAERLLFDTVPLLLGDITLLAQSDRVALQHLHVLQSKIDALVDPFLGAIKEQKGSVLGLAGTRWSEKYKGVSAGDMAAKKKELEAKLDKLLGSLSRKSKSNKTSSSNPFTLLTQEEDDDSARVSATELPLVFACEKELVDIEKKIESHLSPFAAVAVDLIPSSAPKCVLYRGGETQGGKFFYEGESQAEAADERDMSAGKTGFKIRLLNPFDVSKMPESARPDVEPGPDAKFEAWAGCTEMDQWDARDTVTALQRLVKGGSVRSLLTSLVSEPHSTAEIHKFLNDLDSVMRLVAAKCFLRENGSPVLFDEESVLRPMFTFYDKQLTAALMCDWCELVSVQREYASEARAYVAEVRTLESEIMYLDGGPGRDAQEAAKRKDVKAKFDLMYNGLREMCMGETGTVFQMDELSTYPVGATDEEMKVYKEKVQKNRDKWDWLGKRQEDVWAQEKTERENK